MIHAPKRLFLLASTLALLLCVTGILLLWRIPHWGSAKQSPLHSAVMADDLDQVRALLPKSPPGASDQQLFYARSAAVAEFLISSGASVSARDHGNCTPLHFAAAMGHREVIVVLLRHGADVNATDDGKITPLMLAVGFGGDPDEGFEIEDGDISQAHRLADVQLLLTAGAIVDARDSSDETALMHATYGGNCSSIVKALVDAGANVNVRSLQNDTPLHGAAFTSELETIRLLVEHGADVTVKEWQGKTARDGVQGTGPDADEMRRLLSK